MRGTSRVVARGLIVRPRPSSRSTATTPLTCRDPCRSSTRCTRPWDALGVVQPEDRRRHGGVQREAVVGDRVVGVLQDHQVRIAELGPQPLDPPVRGGVEAAGDVPGPVRRRDRQRLATDGGGRGGEERLRRARVPRHDHLRRRRVPVLRRQARRHVTGGRTAEPERAQRGERVDDVPHQRRRHDERQRRQVERVQDVTRRRGHAARLVQRPALQRVDPADAVAAGRQRVDAAEPVRDGRPGGEQGGRDARVGGAVEDEARWGVGHGGSSRGHHEGPPNRPLDTADVPSLHPGYVRGPSDQGAALTPAHRPPAHASRPSVPVAAIVFAGYVVIVIGLMLASGVGYEDFFDTADSTLRSAVLPLAAGGGLAGRVPRVGAVGLRLPRRPSAPDGRVPLGRSPRSWSSPLVLQLAGRRLVRVRSRPTCWRSSRRRVLVGFTEETLFRGIILRALRQGDRSEARRRRVADPVVRRVPPDQPAARRARCGHPGRLRGPVRRGVLPRATRHDRAGRGDGAARVVGLLDVPRGRAPRRRRLQQRSELPGRGHLPARRRDAGRAAGPRAQDGPRATPWNPPRLELSQIRLGRCLVSDTAHQEET